MCSDEGKGQRNRAAYFWTYLHHRHLSSCLFPIFPKITSSILFVKLVRFRSSALENTSTGQTCVCHGNQRLSLLLLFATSNTVLVATDFLRWPDSCVTNQLCLEHSVMSLRNWIEIEAWKRPPSCPQKTDMGPDTLTTHTPKARSRKYWFPPTRSDPKELLLLTSADSLLLLLRWIRVNSKATSRAVATRDGMPAANPREGPQSWRRERAESGSPRIKEKLNWLKIKQNKNLCGP